MHACTALASKVFRTQKKITKIIIIIIKDFYLQSLSPLKIATHSSSKLRDLIFFWGFVFYFFFSLLFILLLLQLMKGNNEFDCNGTKINKFLIEICKHDFRTHFLKISKDVLRKEGEVDY